MKEHNDVLNPSFPKTMDNFKKQETVYVVYSTESGMFASLGECMFSAAYKSAEGAKRNCWWCHENGFHGKLNRDRTFRIDSMTADEFVTKNLEENQGMNPFESLARWEFKAKWNEKV